MRLTGISLENRIGYGEYGQLSIATVWVEDSNDFKKAALFYVLLDGSFDIGSMIVKP
jgi:hypothetical protein